MIKIMVDSSSDCQQKKGAYDLLIPLTVSIGGKDYQDGLELNADLFYELLLSNKEFPKTSQPSPESFVNHFEKIKADGDELLCFTLSSNLSGTYQSACIAKSMVDYDGIYIIDTLTATHMIGIMVESAAKLIGDGLSAKEIAEKCTELRSRVHVFAGLDTLEYLYKGGRLSRASATVGEIAGIKPLITVTEDGKVSAVAKAIGVPRAIQTILNKVKSFEVDENFPIYSLYSHGVENCKNLEDKLTAAGYAIAERRQIGSTIGAHVGPGAYAVAFVAK